MADEANVNAAFQMLSKFNQKELAGGVPDDELRNIARQAQQWCKEVKKYGLSTEDLEQILMLALYDVVLLLDDSGSMRREEYPKRIDGMRAVAQMIFRVNMVFREANPAIVENGIHVKMLNSNDRFVGQRSQIHTDEEFTAEFDKVSFGGWTRLGGVLRSKITLPLVYNTNMSVRKKKPLLISIITDGQPEGEEIGALKKELQTCKAFVDNSRELGYKSVVFQISQVGNDNKAQRFLHELEGDPQLNQIIDCTSNSELEARRREVGSELNLSEELRTIKMLAGALLTDFDSYHMETWKI